MIQESNKIKVANFLKNGYLSYIFALLSVIVLPIHVQYIPPFMILWGISWVIENYSRFNLILNSRTEYKVLLFLFVSFYMWEVISLIYTTDINLGLLNLYGRLSLVLFPIVLIFPGKMISKKAKLLIRIFALCTGLFMLFSFSYALFRSVNLNDGLCTFNPHPPEFWWLSYFYSSELTVFQHPSYISMYVLFSVFICFEAWYDYSLDFTRRILWLILGAFLSISQYFLSSRVGIITSLILVSLYFIYKFKRVGKRKFAWLWIIIIIIAILPILVKNLRVNALYDRIFDKSVSNEQNIDPRFQIWKSSLKIAKNNFLFGVGIGDVRRELAKEYLKLGEYQMAKDRYNAHNQFLEVQLEGGIIGLLLLILIFIEMSYIAFSDRNILLGIFIMIVFMFFLFETVLYRLAGVSFFSLFSFLLLHINSQKKNLN